MFVRHRRPALRLSAAAIIAGTYIAATLGS
jgi:hypothetical protein